MGICICLLYQRAQHDKYRLITQASKSFFLTKFKHVYVRKLKRFMNKYKNPTFFIPFPTKFSTKLLILKKNIVKLI